MERNRQLKCCLQSGRLYFASYRLLFAISLLLYSFDGVYSDLRTTNFSIKTEHFPQGSNRRSSSESLDISRVFYCLPDTYHHL